MRATLYDAQRTSDRRLIDFCERQTEESLAEGLVLPRPNRTPPPTSVASILAHLFQHQIHHRGQAHAMLRSTPVKPPQLDEFFLAGEEHLRRDELRALGLPLALMRPRSSFAGAAIEVSDLARSVAFHRLWLPMLGFRRVWASPDRVMWSRGYDHFVMRQAKDGMSYGPGALWLAVSAESRAQVDQVYAELRDAGAEILQPPKELDYFAPGYYSVAFRDPDGVPIEVAHRWDELPDLADAEQVQVPGHGVTLGGYFFKPQAGKPPYPAVILLHGFAGHAHSMAGLARAAPRQRLRSARAVAARLAGLGGRERPGPAPAARRAGGDRLAGQAAAGRPRAHRRWSAPRWAARWRCWPPPTSRRSGPSPRSSRRPIWRAGARPIRSSATISTICAGPRACRCARRSCGWRRSTRRCC